MTHEQYWNLCACGGISPQAYHKWVDGERWTAEAFEYEGKYWYRVHIEGYDGTRSFIVSFVYPEMANDWFRKQFRSGRNPFLKKSLTVIK